MSPIVLDVGSILRPLISFCRCRVEGKRGTIRRVKYWPATLVILATLSASIVLGDDFKTINGKEYKSGAPKRNEHARA